MKKYNLCPCFVICAEADLRIGELQWGDSGVYFCKVVIADDLEGKNEDQVELLVLGKHARKLTYIFLFVCLFGSFFLRVVGKGFRSGLLIVLHSRVPLLRFPWKQLNGVSLFTCPRSSVTDSIL